MDRKHSFNIGYAILALVLFGFFQLWLGWRDVTQLPGGGGYCLR